MTKPLYLSALLLLAATACGGRAPAPAAPGTGASDPEPVAGCMMAGDVLYRETTAPILLFDHRREVLTIYETGAWSLEGERRQLRGCLAEPELDALRARLTVVRRMPPDRATCAALPTYETLVEVPSVGALSYQWPCTFGPDEPTAAGIECARDLTWRSDAQAAVCERSSGVTLPASGEASAAGRRG